MKIENYTEKRIQSDCFMWFHNAFTNRRGTFFRIKNEGTSAISGALDKSTGLVAGVADMCLLLDDGLVIFVEFKKDMGKQSFAQSVWQSKIKEFGHNYIIIRSLEEFKELCKKLGLNWSTLK